MAIATPGPWDACLWSSVRVWEFVLACVCPHFCSCPMSGAEASIRINGVLLGGDCLLAQYGFFCLIICGLRSQSLGHRPYQMTYVLPCPAPHTVLPFTHPWVRCPNAQTACFPLWGNLPACGSRSWLLCWARCFSCLLSPCKPTEISHPFSVLRKLR